MLHKLAWKINCKTPGRAGLALIRYSRNTLSTLRVPVLLFKPKYQLVHPESYLFVLSENILLGSKYPTNNLFDLNTGALVSTPDNTMHQSNPRAMICAHNMHWMYLKFKWHMFQTHWPCKYFLVWQQNVHTLFNTSARFLFYIFRFFRDFFAVSEVKWADALCACFYNVRNAARCRAINRRCSVSCSLHTVKHDNIVQCSPSMIIFLNDPQTWWTLGESTPQHSAPSSSHSKHSKRLSRDVGGLKHFAFLPQAAPSTVPAHKAVASVAKTCLNTH